MSKAAVPAVLVALLAFIALLIALLFETVPDGGKTSVTLVVIEQLFQFSLIGVLGVLGKRLIDRSQRTLDERRAARERQEQRFRSVSGSLRELLRQTRLAHHAVRTTPLDVERSRDLNGYDAGMRSLVDARQRYIEIGDELSHTELRHYVDGSIHDHIRKVITYLSNILTERYKSAPADWEAVTALPRFGELRKGTLDFRESSASPEYRDRYDGEYEAIKSLLHAALEPERLMESVEALHRAS